MDSPKHPIRGDGGNRPPRSPKSPHRDKTGVPIFPIGQSPRKGVDEHSTNISRAEADRARSDGSMRYMQKTGITVAIPSEAREPLISKFPIVLYDCFLHKFLEFLITCTSIHL